MDIVQIASLLLFLGSTPIAMFFVFVLGQDRHFWAIANNYGFTFGMNLLFIYPFVLPSYGSFSKRVNTAIMNWIIWVTLFTQIIFQIPHNLFVSTLHQMRGTVVEWPFWSYGLSDSRWSNYHDGKGLAEEVWFINWNDAGLGLLVLFAFLYFRYSHTRSSYILFILVTLFRDATLWRETVEYMIQHHQLGYPLTIHDDTWRKHAIAGLWLINFAWLIAPLVTVIWAYQQLTTKDTNVKLA